MAQLDSNTWYQLTETRVDFNSALQFDGGSSLLMGAAKTDVNEWWQFQPLDNNQWQVRNKQSYVSKQLGTCYSADEVTDTKTRPCMVNSNYTDLSQRWNISVWSDGTLKFANVGNGTGYNMDCHPDNPMFMSDATAETPNQPAQHWELKSIGIVNDGTFSTTYVSSFFKC
jgi:hypothetical protein